MAFGLLHNSKLLSVFTLLILTGGGGMNEFRSVEGIKCYVCPQDENLCPPSDPTLKFEECTGVKDNACLLQETDRGHVYSCIKFDLPESSQCQLRTTGKQKTCICKQDGCNFKDCTCDPNDTSKVVEGSGANPAGNPTETSALQKGNSSGAMRIKVGAGIPVAGLILSMMMSFYAVA